MRRRRTVPANSHLKTPKSHHVFAFQHHRKLAFDIPLIPADDAGFGIEFPLLVMNSEVIALGDVLSRSPVSTRSVWVRHV